MLLIKRKNCNKHKINNIPEKAITNKNKISEIGTEVGGIIIENMLTDNPDWKIQAEY